MNGLPYISHRLFAAAVNGRHRAGMEQDDETQPLDRAEHDSNEFPVEPAALAPAVAVIAPQRLLAVTVHGRH